ncbi:MAG: Txe/YoeB family addiction module toxin [Bacteroidales bacterium]|nr:Txe/YoeB family addiction module toxin [Bacteroidales bacterium]
MGLYIIEYTETAVKELKQLKKTGNKATLNKIDKIINELKVHPKIGAGKPEQLKHELQGYWSRRINHKDRMIYKIEENKVIVTVISVMGHYSDK